MLISIATMEIVRRRVDTTGHRAATRALLVVNVLLIGSVVGFGLASSFGLALATFWSAQLMRRINAPIYTARLNQGLDSNVRASVLSMGSQADALGQIVGGPLLPALALYTCTLRREDAEPAPPAAAVAGTAAPD